MRNSRIGLALMAASAIILAAMGASIDRVFGLAAASVGFLTILAAAVIWASERRDRSG